MEKVILYYNNSLDYLFEIDSIENMEKAIQYKNDKIYDEDFLMSDFEYILEYLDNNGIEYSYTELFNVKRIEY